MYLLQSLGSKSFLYTHSTSLSKQTCNPCHPMTIKEIAMIVNTNCAPEIRYSVATSDAPLGRILFEMKNLRTVNAHSTVRACCTASQPIMEQSSLRVGEQFTYPPERSCAALTLTNSHASNAQLTALKTGFGFTPLEELVGMFESSRTLDM